MRFAHRNRDLLLQVTLACIGLAAIFEPLAIEAVNQAEAEAEFKKGIESVTKDNPEAKRILTKIFEQLPLPDSSQTSIEVAMKEFKIKSSNSRSHHVGKNRSLWSWLKGAWNSVMGTVCNWGYEKPDCQRNCACTRNPVKDRVGCPAACPILPRNKTLCAPPPICPNQCWRYSEQSVLTDEIINYRDDSIPPSAFIIRNFNKVSSFTRQRAYHRSLQMKGLKLMRLQMNGTSSVEQNYAAIDTKIKRSKRQVMMNNDFNLRGVQYFNEFVNKLPDEQKRHVRALFSAIPEKATIDFVGDVLSALEQFNDNLPKDVILEYERLKEEERINSGSRMDFGLGATIGMGVASNLISSGIQWGITGLVGHVCKGYRETKCDCSKYPCQLPAILNWCDSIRCPNYIGCPIYRCECDNRQFRESYMNHR